MSGCLDLTLGWSRGNAVTEITGNVWLDDLNAGESRVIYVDHSSAGEFSLPLMPCIDKAQGDCDGLTVEVLAMATIDSVVRTTDGSGFVARVTVDAGASGADQGRGGSDWDWHLYWTRRGVL